VVLDELEVRLASLTTLRAERELREQAERDRLEVETFATTLQRTLVPPTLPAVPGLQLASRYHTASARQVDGDFYDVFPVTGGRWAAVLGDVCGKGAPAASLTSFIRYTLRSLLHHHDDPLQVLDELNTALRAEQSNDDHPRFATLLLLTLTSEAGFGSDPDAGVAVTVTAGGHPPPYLLRADGGIEAVDTPGGMLLGVLPDAEFTTGNHGSVSSTSPRSARPRPTDRHDLSPGTGH
jgi:sigma-B regulation protein RsbU (phosphoserine phosphatase)